MRVNSRAKGARGEREAAKFLRGLGFEARRGQQFSGSKDSPDVVTNLAGVHIENKFGVQGMDLGTQLLDNAVNQAKAECGGKRWVVLWKPSRCAWRLTYALPSGAVATVCGDEVIGATLRELNL